MDYGGRLMDEGGLVFDPGEMTQALHVPLEAVDVVANTVGADFLAPQPFEVACFPYAQHFLTSSNPRATPIRDEEGLVDAVREYAAAGS